MININSKIYIKFFSLLIYLYPLTLIFSVFLSNLIVSLVSLFAIFNIKDIKFNKFLKNKYFLLFLMFWFYISLRSIFLENILFSIKSSFLFIKYLFFTLTIIILIDRNKNFVSNFLKFFLIIYFALASDALIQFFYGKNLLGYNALNIENNRISGFFGDELILGSYVARLSFLIIALLAISNFKDKKIIIFVVLFLSFIIGLISGERTALALSCMSILYYIIQTHSIRSNIKITILTSISILFIIFYSLSEKIQSRMAMTFTDIQSADNILTFTKGHQSHYGTAVNLFNDNILFGQGANMFRKRCSEKNFFVEPYGCSTHPHNIYLQLLAETGFIGFLFIIFLFYKIIAYSLKHFYSKYILKKVFLTEFELCILTCFLINFWPIIPTGNFFSSSFGNIAILPISFAFLSNKINKNFF